MQLPETLWEVSLGACGPKEREIKILGFQLEPVHAYWILVKLLQVSLYLVHI